MRLFSEQTFLPKRKMDIISPLLISPVLEDAFLLSSSLSVSHTFLVFCWNRITTRRTRKEYHRRGDREKKSPSKGNKMKINHGDPFCLLHIILGGEQQTAPTHNLTYHVPMRIAKDFLEMFFCFSSKDSKRRLLSGRRGRSRRLRSKQEIKKIFGEVLK